MDLQLNGKRALVTGSTSGIGTAIARTLAREGAAVAINGRNRHAGEEVVEAIRAEGGTAVLAIGDLSSDAGADATVAAALEGLGGVDILVNNAGGRSSENGTTSFLDLTPEEWIGTFQMNVLATLRLAKRLTPAMVERHWGRLIQISSGAGMTPTGATADYAAAKASISNFTVGLSKGLSKTGVTINTVSPGMIMTPGLDGWIADIARQQGFGDDRAKSEAFAIANYVPQTVEQFGQVDDIANIVAYLASPLAGFVNGANFRVDGGYSPSVN